MLVNAKVAAIECQGDAFRVAVIKIGGKRPHVLELHSARAEYGDEEDRFEARVAALEGLLNGMKSAPAAYIFCAHCHDAVVRNIVIPFKGQRRVAAAVQFELEPHLAFPIEELLLDFKISGEHDGETDVLAMGLRRAQLEEDLAVLAAAGVVADAVTLDAAGLTGLWQSVVKGLKGLQAVVHLRDTGAVFVITDGKRPAYFRGLNATAADFREDPVRVAREVQHTLRAFAAQWRGSGDVSSLHLTGADLDEEVVEAFAAALGMPVQVTDLMGALSGGDKAAGADAGTETADAWASCVGAALCAAGGHFALDFKRAEHSWRGGLRGIVAHLMFSSCLGLLLLLCTAFFFHQSALQNDAVAAELWGRVDEVEEEVKKLKTEGVGEGIDMEMFSAPTLLDTLTEIATKMPDNKVKIEEINISAVSRTWMTIRGTAETDEKFNQVFEALRESSLFRVDDEPRRNLLENGMTRFTIKAERIVEAADE